jgi:hypothetical protein
MAASEWQDAVQSGIRQATGALIVLLIVAGLRIGMDWVRRLVRRGWGRESETEAAPGKPEPRWAAHVLGALFAVGPLGLGLYRLAQGRFLVWRTTARSPHPNPPLYLYEGSAATLYSLALIAWGLATYCVVAGWPSRRWRWPGVGAGLLGLYGGLRSVCRGARPGGEGALRAVRKSFVNPLLDRWGLRWSHRNIPEAEVGSVVDPGPGARV